MGQGAHDGLTYLFKLGWLEEWEDEQEGWALKRFERTVCCSGRSEPRFLPVDVFLTEDSSRVVENAYDLCDCIRGK